MKHEILFRGKCFDNGKWIEGYLIGKDVISAGEPDIDEDYIAFDDWCSVTPKPSGSLQAKTM
jgi:hypothetical protein